MKLKDYDLKLSIYVHHTHVTISTRHEVSDWKFTVSLAHPLSYAIKQQQRYIIPTEKTR